MGRKAISVTGIWVADRKG